MVHVENSLKNGKGAIRTWPAAISNGLDEKCSVQQADRDGSVLEAMRWLDLMNFRRVEPEESVYAPERGRIVREMVSQMRTRRNAY